MNGRNPFCWAGNRTRGVRCGAVRRDLACMQVLPQCLNVLNESILLAVHVFADVNPARGHGRENGLGAAQSLQAGGEVVGPYCARESVADIEGEPRLKPRHRESEEGFEQEGRDEQGAKSQEEWGAGVDADLA